jgi:hypothetical protein
MNICPLDAYDNNVPLYNARAGLRLNNRLLFEESEISAGVLVGEKGIVPKSTKARDMMSFNLVHCRLTVVVYLCHSAGGQHLSESRGARCTVARGSLQVARQILVDRRRPRERAPATNQTRLRLGSDINIPIDTGEPVHLTLRQLQFLSTGSSNVI